MKTPRALIIFLPVLALVLLPACEGPDRKAMREEARHSVPPLAGKEIYFDGAIIARLSLGGGLGSEAFGLNHSDRGARDDAMRTSLGKTGGVNSGMGEGNFGGGMAHSAGGGANLESTTTETDGASSRRRGDTSSTYQGNKGMRGESEDAPDEPRQRNRDSEMPPALLQMRLENTTEATIVVEVRELNSVLGNFAVRPETITLAPGQAVEVDPMQSLLGLESFTVPVTLSLRSGGVTQSKTVTLELVKPAAPPSASVPPPPAH